jgi:hypothetical protein
MKFYDIKQNSDEWYSIRVGIITGSKISCIMANDDKVFGEVAKKYATNLAIEQLTGVKIDSEFYNKDMKRGHEQEPLAISLYEEYNFCEIKNGGFFTDGFVGCSPDGLVGDDGLIEVKSVIPTTHYNNMKRFTVDPAYKWQVYFNLYITNRKWIDFVSYCDNYFESKKIFIHRLYRDDLVHEFERMNKRIDNFLHYIKLRKQEIIESKTDNY